MSAAPSSWMNRARRLRTLASVASAARTYSRADGVAGDAARRALIASLSDARGVPLKIGQLLATRDADQWATVITDVTPLPLTELRDDIEARLGAPLERVFRSFSESSAAASLGQVHRAERIEGGSVAVKVQYPGIADAIDAELALAGLLPGLGPVSRWGFDLAGYKAQLSASIRRELDYGREAVTQERMRTGLAGTGLSVPEVMPSLCRPGLLVQEWADGQPLSCARTWRPDERRIIAESLLRGFLRSVFQLGEVHADPHPGNLLVQRAPQAVWLLDWGCTVTVPLARRRALLKLILGARDRDQTDAMACLVSAGFDAEKLADVADQLPAVCDVLVEPFACRAPFDVRNWRMSERIDLLLGDARWWFRSAGPPDLLLMVRALHGVSVQLAELGVRLDWFQMLTQALDAQLLTTARDWTPPVRFQVERQRVGFAEVAQWLRVAVDRDGKKLVRVALPARRALDLASLMPPDVLRAARQQHIDFNAITARIRKSGLARQDLFSLTNDRKSYRVWLD